MFQGLRPVKAIGYSPGSSTTDTASVSDPLPGRPGRSQRAGAESDKRTLFERLVEFLSPGPDSRAELIETLAEAEHRSLIEPESRVMLEGVLRMADRTAGDVMVAAPRERAPRPTSVPCSSAWSSSCLPAPIPAPS